MSRTEQDGALKPPVDYLRISITDRCNLRCIYCMPADGVRSLHHEDMMSYEEMELFARAAVSSGIRRIRLTGGEPLVRKGAVHFVRMLASIDPDLKITMTTNGQMLARHAAALIDAGLRRVNVSIDSLDPETYAKITRGGDVGDVRLGISRAVELGIAPVKLNVVLLKGLNDDPGPFVDLSRELPVHIRFIEYMPYFGERNGRWFVPAEAVRRKIERIGPLEVASPPEGWGPAEYYSLPGAPGTLGFISPVSCHFCPSCNRLRISADGRVRTCLFDRDGVDVRREIRAGAGFDRLREIIGAELDRKRREGRGNPRFRIGERARDHMSRIGG